MFLFFVTTFLIGSAVGSFLNVVIDRTTNGQAIAGKNHWRSHCDHCKATLSTIDLVPIISFVLLGAKCRYCGKPLSWQYPAVEFTTAVLFTLVFYVLATMGSLNFVTILLYFYLISTVIVVAVIDIKYYLIPTTFVYLASFITLFYNYSFFSQSVFIEHIIAAFGAALFFLIIVLVTRGKGMGQGDIVLAFLMGIVLGYSGTFLAMFIAFLLGSVVSIFLIILGKKKFGQTVPFAPFLVMGFLISLLYSSELISWYLLMLY